jgi:hypothetical protein
MTQELSRDERKEMERMFQDVLRALSAAFPPHVGIALMTWNKGHPELCNWTTTVSREEGLQALDSTIARLKAQSGGNRPITKTVH